MGIARGPQRQESIPADLAEHIISGQNRALYAYRDSAGAVPVLQFIEGLPEDAQGRYLRRFKVLAERGYLDAVDGHPLGGKQHRDCHGLWEIKDNASQSRIIYFADGAQGVLVLGLAFGGKKENKIDETQIARAKRVMADYQARRAAATPQRSAAQQIGAGRRR